MKNLLLSVLFMFATSVLFSGTSCKNKIPIVNKEMSSNLSSMLQVGDTITVIGKPEIINTYEIQCHWIFFWKKCCTVINISNPDLEKTVFVYDEDGNIINQIDASEVRISREGDVDVVRIIP